MSEKEFEREKTGVLFRNQKKESDRHPDYTGSATVEGVEYWLSAWIKEAKSGTKFMSLAMKPKEETAPKPKGKPASRQAAPPDDIESDIPFAPIGKRMTHLV